MTLWILLLAAALFVGLFGFGALASSAAILAQLLFLLLLVAFVASVFTANEVEA